MFVKAYAVAATLAAIGVGSSAAPKAIGKPGITPAPCPDQSWEEEDATFAALSGARVSFGHNEGGTYRIEIPDKWNGELVLWAHGYTSSAGALASRFTENASTVTDVKELISAAE